MAPGHAALPARRPGRHRVERRPDPGARAGRHRGRVTGIRPVNGPAEAGPLQGITVVELAHWMAAPAAAGVLADWGADVIKVEPPGGEPMRRVWGRAGGNPGAPQ